MREFRVFPGWKPDRARHAFRSGFDLSEIAGAPGERRLAVSPPRLSRTPERCAREDASRGKSLHETGGGWMHRVRAPQWAASTIAPGVSVRTSCEVCALDQGASILAMAEVERLERQGLARLRHVEGDAQGLEGAGRTGKSVAWHASQLGTRSVRVALGAGGKVQRRGPSRPCSAEVSFRDRQNAGQYNPKRRGGRPGRDPHEWRLA